MADADLEQTQNLIRQPPEQPGAPGAASNGDRLKPLSSNRIEVEVKDRLFREVKRQIFPREVEGILLQTQTGIPYWQDQLFSTMVDTWPRLETNLGKLKKAASSMEYEVKAYTAKGESPTAAAIAKANFVEAALFGMQSDTPWGFHDFKETVSDLIDSIISGLTVLEVYWENQTNLGMVPKCTRWIPARYYRYPYVMDAPDRLMLNPSGMLGSTALVDFPPAQFLIGQVQSHANFPVYTAPMRCLTPYWIGARFGLEWFMTYAQLFGMPQRIAYYEPGDDQVYAELVAMMKASAAATWGVYPKGTEILLQAASNSGTFLPQERLMEVADRICDIMILGQTLTTDVQDSGSRALGSVHRSVLEEVYEAAARYASKVITTQLIPSIVGFNFGDQEELPVLQPVVHTPIDLLQISNAFNILFNQMKIPVSKQELYERIEFTPPEADQELYEPPGAAAGAPPPMSSTGGGGAGEQADIGTEASNQLALSASNEEDFDDEKIVDARRATLVQPKVPQDLDRGPAEKAMAIDTEQYFKENAGSIKGIKWQSVMDDRTTPECRELNAKRWRYPDLTPIGHDTEFPGFPPIKWNCRSSVQPVLKTWPQILSWLKGGFGRKTVRAQSGEETGHGGNPYHDEKGRFTGPGSQGEAKHEGPTESAPTPEGQSVKKKPRRLSDPAQIIKKAKEMGKTANWEQLQQAKVERQRASDALFAAPEGEAKKAWDNLFAARKNLKDANLQWGQTNAEFKSMIELPKTERGKFEFMPSKTSAEPKARLQAQLADASDWLVSMVHKERIAGTAMEVHPEVIREHFQPSEGAIHLCQDSNAHVAVHEVGHRLEYFKPKWLKADNDFLESRTAGETPVALATIYTNDGYKPEEMTREDKWAQLGGTAYSGKNYSDGETEILSTGLERMYKDPLEFAIRDPEFFTHVFTLIRSKPEYS